jgi:hypothetical protein
MTAPEADKPAAPEAEQQAVSTAEASIANGQETATLAQDLKRDIEGRKDTPFSKALKLLTYPVSALVGYKIMKSQIRDATYDNLKRYDAFEDIRPAHHDQLHKMIERFQKGEPVNILKETVRQQEKYQAQLTARFKELGLGTIEKQWEFIHKSQKQNVLLNGFTAAGITIGALLTMANSKSFVDVLDQSQENGASPEI